MFIDISLDLICIYKIVNYKSNYIIGFKNLDSSKPINVGTYISCATFKIYIEESLWFDYIIDKKDNCYCWSNINYNINICDSFAILDLFNLILDEVTTYNNYNNSLSYESDCEDSFKKRCNNIAILLNNYVYF